MVLGISLSPSITLDLQIMRRVAVRFYWSRNQEDLIHTGCSSGLSHSVVLNFCSLHEAH